MESQEVYTQPTIATVTETLNGAIKVLKGMFDIKGLIYMGIYTVKSVEITRRYKSLTRGIFGYRVNLIVLILSLGIVFLIKNSYIFN